MKDKEKLEDTWKDLELALSYLDPKDRMQELASLRIQKAQKLIIYLLTIN